MACKYTLNFNRICDSYIKLSFYCFTFNPHIPIFPPIQRNVGKRAMDGYSFSPTFSPHGEIKLAALLTEKNVALSPHSRTILYRYVPITKHIIQRIIAISYVHISFRKWRDNYLSQNFVPFIQSFQIIKCYTLQRLITTPAYMDL